MCIISFVFLVSSIYGSNYGEAPEVSSRSHLRVNSRGGKQTNWSSKNWRKWEAPALRRVHSAVMKYALAVRIAQGIRILGFVAVEAISFCRRCSSLTGSHELHKWKCTHSVNHMIFVQIVCWRIGRGGLRNDCDVSNSSTKVQMRWRIARNSPRTWKTSI